MSFRHYTRLRYEFRFVASLSTRRFNSCWYDCLLKFLKRKKLILNAKLSCEICVPIRIRKFVTDGVPTRIRNYYFFLIETRQFENKITRKEYLKNVRAINVSIK